MPFNLGTTLKSALAAGNQGLQNYGAAQQFINGGNASNFATAQNNWQTAQQLQQQQQQPKPTQWSNPSFWGNALAGGQTPPIPNGNPDFAALLQALSSGQQGTQNNPYAAQNMPQPQGSMNTPMVSAVNTGAGVSQGQGGTPVLEGTPTYGYEQFFQGGGVPQQQFNLTQGEQMSADKKANPDLKGIKWLGDQVLETVEKWAPMAGGILGGITPAGPVGALAGGAIGTGASKLATWGREGLRGK